MIGYVVRDEFVAMEDNIMTEAIIRERLAELNDLLARNRLGVDNDH